MTDDLVKRAKAIDPLCATQCCANSHLYGELADRIEELEAKLVKTQGAEDFWESCAVKNEKRWEKAEAKLAKAVQALEGLMMHMPDYVDTIWIEARAALAELKGKTDDLPSPELKTGPEG